MCEPETVDVDAEEELLCTSALVACAFAVANSASRPWMVLRRDEHLCSYCSMAYSSAIVKLTQEQGNS